ncbi:methyltransferase domain-containing protein [Rhizoctonia solani AG-1 IA]|uniref:Protein-lysine N-methyltransferase EFM4 n=1 Tax=Thanatephorus cucumeris (strain AG1-IA) TaxID=983506 RepID=L8WTB9_THACA|nr:methyltransferase domain-containing protein [Rhizoctonia solani AG-1 IA]
MLSSSDIVANKTKSRSHQESKPSTMVTELKPTKLGKREYWDDVYNNEVENFETNGDEGEVWFGEETVEKMLEWTLDNYPPNTEPYVLDIGTGNGIMTVTLAENGYDPGHLVGLDYSEPSVKLARAVANARGHSSIRYVVSDFINETAPAPTEGVSPGNWDLLQVLPPPKSARWILIILAGLIRVPTMQLHYPGGLKTGRLLSRGILPRFDAMATKTLFLACNFTEEELKEAFGAPELGLTYHDLKLAHTTSNLYIRGEIRQCVRLGRIQEKLGD